MVLNIIIGAILLILVGLGCVALIYCIKLKKAKSRKKTSEDGQHKSSLDVQQKLKQNEFEDHDEEHMYHASDANIRNGKDMVFAHAASAHQNYGKVQSERLKSSLPPPTPGDKFDDGDYERHMSMAMARNSVHGTNIKRRTDSNSSMVMKHKQHQHENGNSGSYSYRNSYINANGKVVKLPGPTPGDLMEDGDYERFHSFASAAVNPRTSIQKDKSNRHSVPVPQLQNNHNPINPQNDHDHDNMHEKLTLTFTKEKTTTVQLQNMVMKIIFTIHQLLAHIPAKIHFLHQSHPPDAAR